jgi:hypothetical protein
MASPEAGRAGPIDFIGRVQESRVFEGLVDESSHDCPLIFPTKPLDVLWEINGKIGKYSSFSSVVPIQEPAAKRSNSGATATATTASVQVPLAALCTWDFSVLPRFQVVVEVFMFYFSKFHAAFPAELGEFRCSKALLSAPFGATYRCATNLAAQDYVADVLEKRAPHRAGSMARM